MEVKPGYKQTEVGVIPEDWNVKRLGDVATFHKGKGLPKSALTLYGSEPCVHYGELFTQYGETISETISRTVRTPGQFRSVANDVLMPTSDVTPRGLAKASCVIADDVVLGGDVLVIRTDAALISGTFLSYVIRREESQVLRLVNGTTVFHLYGTDMKKFTFKIPPTFAEQQAIIDVLSDMDAEVAAIEALRDKKHDLKQAAMQQLLTGQTRLPGFHDEWEVKRLDMVADVLKGSGLSKSQTTSSGVRPCILYGELFTAYGRIIADVVGRTNSIDGCNSQQGDVLMPGSTTTTGSDLAIASALFVDGVALGGDIIIIRRKDDSYDSVFLANYLTHAKKQEIAEFTQGITIHHLYGKNMRCLSLDLPHLSEQTAIADVLSDMDAELAALEARRDKTRNLKQAMMQELLTGKTRLVTPEVPHA